MTTPAPAAPHYPLVTYTAPRRRDRLLARKRTAYAAVSADLYLLSSSAAPTDFAHFRAAQRYDLPRGRTAVATPHDGDARAVLVETAAAKPAALVLVCADPEDALVLARRVAAAATPLAGLRAALLARRRVRPHDAALRDWLRALRAPPETAAPAHRDASSALAASLAAVARGLRGSARALHDAPEWASAVAVAVSSAGPAVDSLQRAFGALPIAAPLLAVAGLAADLAALAVESAERAVEMRALSARCSAVARDVVAALFFSLDYASVEDALVDKLFVVLEKVCNIACVAERFVMSGRVRQMLTAEETASLSGEVRDIEALVTSMRILQYVQENHARNQRVDEREKDVFRRSFLVAPVPVSSCLMFEQEEAPEAVVRKKLFDEACTSGLVGVVGMSGVGKTTILRAISNEPSIRRCFDGGIYEMQIGATGSFDQIAAVLAGAVQNSGGNIVAEKIRACKSLHDAVITAKEWFFGHRCLFVWDGVEASPEFETGLVRELRTIADLTVGARALFSTRDQALAIDVANRRDAIRIEPRSRDISQSIFCKHGEIDISLIRQLRQKRESSTELRAFDFLLDKCEGLPLALAAAGKEVADMRAIDDRGPLAACLALSKKEMRENEVAFKALGTTEMEGYSGFEQTLNAMWHSLISAGFEGAGMSAAELCHMCNGLCVVESGTWTPCSVLQRAWNVSLDKAVDLVLLLERFSLVRTRRLGTNVEVSVHNLVLVYCVRRALEDLKVPYETWHKAVLESYKHTGVGARLQSWKFGNSTDEYLRKNFTRHVLQAGQSDELKDLLLDFRWIRRSLEVDNEKRQAALGILQEDYTILNRVWLPRRQFRTSALFKEVCESLQLVSDALRLSRAAVAETPAEATFQLPGRLLWAKHLPLISRFIASIEAEAVKPRITSVIPSLTSAGGTQGQKIDVGWSILAMATIPDSDQVIVGGKEGASIVDIEKGILGRSLGTRSRFSGEVVSVAVTRDGSRAVCGWESGTVNVWDLHCDENSYSFQTTIGYYRQPSVCVALTPDDQRIVTGSGNGSVRLWDIETGKPIGEPMEGHRNKVVCVAVSNDGQAVASASVDQTVRVWDLNEKKPPKVIDFRTFFGMTFVTWTRDDQNLLLGSEDYKLVVLPVCSEGTVKRTLEGHKNYIIDAAVSDNGRYVVSGSRDNCVRVWDLVSGRTVGGPLRGHIESPVAVCFSHASSRVISASSDGTVRVWRQPWGFQPYSCHDRAVSCITPSPSGDVLASGSYDNTVYIWNMNTCERVIGPLKGEKRRVQSLCFSPDGKLLACGYQTGTVWIFDVTDGSLVQGKMKCHTRGVRYMAFSPDGCLIATAGEDKNASVWNVETETVVHQKLSGHKNWVSCVSFSSDGQLLVTGSLDDHLRLWDAVTGECVAEPIRVLGKPKHVQFIENDSQIRTSLTYCAKPKTFNVSSGEEVMDPASTSEGDAQQESGDPRQQLKMDLDKREIRHASSRKVLARFDHGVSTEEVFDSRRNRVWVGLNDGLVTCVELVE